MREIRHLILLSPNLSVVVVYEQVKVHMVGERERWGGDEEEGVSDVR